MAPLTRGSTSDCSSLSPPSSHFPVHTVAPLSLIPAMVTVEAEGNWKKEAPFGLSGRKMTSLIRS